MTNDDLQAQLHRAIEGGELDELRSLLARGADPNGQYQGKTPLERVPHPGDDLRAELIVAGAWHPGLVGSLAWAVGTERVDLVQRLIDRRADVNVSTAVGTPIYRAARAGLVPIVERLLAAGADPDVGSIVEIPLLAALERGHEEVALRLLEAGANPRAGQVPALVQATCTNATRVVDWLLAHDAKVDERAEQIVVNRGKREAQDRQWFKQVFDDLRAASRATEPSGPDTPPPETEAPILMQQVTALHVAARLGHARVVDTVLRAGADPSSHDGDEQQPFAYAQAHGHQAVLDVMERHGWRPDPPSPDLRLLLAAERGARAGMRAALNKGASTSARDPRKDTRSATPLLLAVTHGHEPAVALLLETGADPDEAEERVEVTSTIEALYAPQYRGIPMGRRPLIEAARIGHVPILSRLLKAGATVDATDATGIDAMRVACHKGMLPVVERLLRANAPLGNCNDNGHTPLLTAIDRGHFSVAHALLDAGASPVEHDRYGETALIKAASRADVTLIERLLSMGAAVDQADDSDNTPLIHALRAHHWAAPEEARMMNVGEDDPRSFEPCPEAPILAAIEVLLGAGASPNPKRLSAFLMSAAVQTGHIKVVERLLAAGTAVTRDAFEMADVLGDAEIIAQLRQHGTRSPTTKTKTKNKNKNKTKADDAPCSQLPVPDLSAAADNPEYRAAVEELAALCGSRPVPRNTVPGHFELHVIHDRKETIDIEDLQARWLERGAYVYEGNWYSNKLEILPSTRLRDVIAVEQTNGANYGFGSSDVAQWLEQLATEHPLVVTRVQDDTVAGRFLRPLGDPKGLAERIYAFCPDTIDQGFEDLEALAKSLAETRTFHLWWD
ncbi:MAG: ankyrin repeat domain-containing protein [Myxococcota bacterium]